MSDSGEFKPVLPEGYKSRLERVLPSDESMPGGGWYLSIEGPIIGHAVPLPPVAGNDADWLQSAANLSVQAIAKRGAKLYRGDEPEDEALTIATVRELREELAALQSGAHKAELRANDAIAKAAHEREAAETYMHERDELASFATSLQQRNDTQAHSIKEDAEMIAELKRQLELEQRRTARAMADTMAAKAENHLTRAELAEQQVKDLHARLEAESKRHDYEIYAMKTELERVTNELTRSQRELESAVARVSEDPGVRRAANARVWQVACMDLTAALGLEINHAVPFNGEENMSEWWAELLETTRTMLRRAAQFEGDLEESNRVRRQLTTELAPLQAGRGKKLRRLEVTVDELTDALNAEQQGKARRNEIDHEAAALILKAYNVLTPGMATMTTGAAAGEANGFESHRGGGLFIPDEPVSPYGGNPAAMSDHAKAMIDSGYAVPTNGAMVTGTNSVAPSDVERAKAAAHWANMRLEDMP
jgi:hypothetical protein